MATRDLTRDGTAVTKRQRSGSVDLNVPYE